MTGPVGSLADVLPSAAAQLGVPGFTDTLGLAGRIGPDVRRIVVVLVDGLGHGLLPRAAASGPLLRAVLSGETGTLAELRSPFPSTTPTSLVTLGTGVAPGQHGVLGFTVNVPGTDRVLTHIVWRDDPPPDRWQPVPTVFERAAAAGVESAVVLPDMFRGSGLTVAAYRGARFAGLGRRADPVAGMLAEVRSGTPLVFGYSAAVDTAAHRYGIASQEWAAAVAEVDVLLQRLVAGLPPDAAVVVTADHGGLDIPAEGRIDLAADPRLLAGLRVVAGEPRVRYLHTRPGAAADVAATWREVLAGRADVLLRADAVARGWFGPVDPGHVPRIGDVVVACRDDTVVLATDREPPEVGRLVGFHGSHSAVETAIPLLCLRSAG